MASAKPSQKPAGPCSILTIPELEHAKAAALGTLVSLHSRRAYKNTIDKFITWYRSEPRLGFNRAVVLRFRSFLESLSLSAATVNLHLPAILESFAPLGMTSSHLGRHLLVAAPRFHFDLIFVFEGQHS